MISKYDELQLRFELEGMDEAADDARERSIPAEEARLISEAARLALFERVQAGQEPEWWKDFMRLLEHGWPWRVACYMGWASSPKVSRLPKTLNELATQFLGLNSPRVIYQWRQKFPSIDATVGMLQASDLWEHRRDVLNALVAEASKADYKSHADRKLYLEMVGDYVPRSQVQVGRSGKGSDLGELSDDELRRWVSGLGQDGQGLEGFEDGQDGGKDSNREIHEIHEQKIKQDGEDVKDGGLGDGGDVG